MSTKNTNYLQSLVDAQPKLRISKAKLKKLPRFHAVPTGDHQHTLTGACACNPLPINPMAWMHQPLKPTRKQLLYTLKLSTAEGVAL